mmetsp:Transcript_4083/g.4209  ORF Transcript_4083/g.4209 Transcript_4083/m.4209 type:complete len:107 (+) Transcript_4083:1072-1392(+)
MLCFSETLPSAVYELPSKVKEKKKIGTTLQNNSECCSHFRSSGNIHVLSLFNKQHPSHLRHIPLLLKTFTNVDRTSSNLTFASCTNSCGIVPLNSSLCEKSNSCNS